MPTTAEVQALLSDIEVADGADVSLTGRWVARAPTGSLGKRKPAPAGHVAELDQQGRVPFDPVIRQGEEITESHRSNSRDRL